MHILRGIRKQVFKDFYRNIPEFKKLPSHIFIAICIFIICVNSYLEALLIVQFTAKWKCALHTVMLSVNTGVWHANSAESIPYNRYKNAENTQLICNNHTWPNNNLFLSDATPYYDAFFGAGIGSVYLDDFLCTGSESRLFHCPHGGLNMVDSCRGHLDDAGVRCCERVLDTWAKLLSVHLPRPQSHTLLIIPLFNLICCSSSYIIP